MILLAVTRKAYICNHIAIKLGIIAELSLGFHFCWKGNFSKPTRFSCTIFWDLKACVYSGLRVLNNLTYQTIFKFEGHIIFNVFIKQKKSSKRSRFFLLQTKVGVCNLRNFKKQFIPGAAANSWPDSSISISMSSSMLIKL